MKTLILAASALALLITGCSSPRSVSNLEGRGTKQTFDYPYDAVWRAAVDAAQQGELEVLSADRNRGYISARRGVQVETFGENVGLWVRSLGPARTEVEVVSRQSGPPVLWIKNWENEILRAVAANVTRETPAVGGTGTQTQIYQESTTAEPREQTTVVIPEPRERTTIVVPESSLAIRDAERRLAELRAEQREREAELQREESERRKQEIRAEIEQLRESLRVQEERLSELERQVK